MLRPQHVAPFSGFAPPSSRAWFRSPSPAATKTRSRAPLRRSRRPTSSSTCPRFPRSICRRRPAMARTRSKSCASRARSCSTPTSRSTASSPGRTTARPRVRKPDETDKDLQKRLDEDPTLCERPKFYIGDAEGHAGREEPVGRRRAAPVQQARDGAHEEAGAQPAGSLRAEGEDPKKNICPPYTVGDEVTITGSFKMSSPHSERNSDGLLVYKKMKNVTQNVGDAGYRAAAGCRFGLSDDATARDEAVADGYAQG